MPNYPNATGQKISDFLGNHVSVKMWGAKGDANTDDTAAIQAAIDDLAAQVGKGTATLTFPSGSYKVTATLTWRRGVCLEGDYTALYPCDPGDPQQSQPATYPRLLWYGPEGDDFLVTEQLGGSIAMQTIKRLSLIGNGTVRDMIAYQDRCDAGTFIDEVQLAGAARYGLRYDVGGINVHLRQFRTDGIAGAAIYWKESGNDLLSLDGFTVDNMRAAPATTSGGALIVDGTESPGNSYFHFGIRNARIEVNTSLPPGRGMFEFRPNLTQELNSNYPAGSIVSGGSNYAVGDTGTVPAVAPDFAGATYQVKAIGGGGAVTDAYIWNNAGVGAACVGNTYPTAHGGTHPGVGTGFTVLMSATMFPLMGNLVQMQGTFDNVGVEPDTTLANYTGLLVTPATDWVQFVLTASRMTVAGIPSWTHPCRTNDHIHILSVISPFTLSAPSPFGSGEKTVVGFGCDVLAEKALSVLGTLSSGSTKITTPSRLISTDPLTHAADLTLDAGKDEVTGQQFEPSITFVQAGDYKYQFYVNWNGDLCIFECGATGGYRLVAHKVTGALQHLGAGFTTSNPEGDNTLTLDAGITLGVVVAAGLGYAIGDGGTVTGGSGPAATYKVTSVGSGGTVTGVMLSTLDGYTPNATYATARGGSYEGTGSGLTVQIASITHYPTFSLSQGSNPLWQLTMGWDGSLRIAQFAPGYTNRVTINPATGLLTNSGPIAVQGSSAYIFSGADAPEHSVTAHVGSIYLRTGGGTDACIYVKESGDLDTGWILYKSTAFDATQYYTKTAADLATAAAITAAEASYYDKTAIDSKITTLQNTINDLIIAIGNASIRGHNHGESQAGTPLHVHVISGSTA